MPSVPRIRETALTFQINNLFNVRYEPNGYSFSYLYGGQLNTENFFFPMAGIHFMAGLTFKW
jgi:iron complex outermembrane receptor protein